MCRVFWSNFWILKRSTNLVSSAYSSKSWTPHPKSPRRKKPSQQQKWSVWTKSWLLSPFFNLTRVKSNDGEVVSYSFQVNCTPCEHRNSMDVLNRFAGNIIGNLDERFRDLHIVSLSFWYLGPFIHPGGWLCETVAWSGGTSSTPSPPLQVLSWWKCIVQTKRKISARIRRLLMDEKHSTNGICSRTTRRQGEC